eukprot:30920-Pelagococcus_subviridis.AAC.20
MSFRTAAAGPKRERSFIHARSQSCENASEDARRNRRCAATHRGSSRFLSSGRRRRRRGRATSSSESESESGSGRSTSATGSPRPHRVRARVERDDTTWFSFASPASLPDQVPLASGAAYLILHVFHIKSKSSSGTNPYLCPYHSMSMESDWNALSVHGSPAARPTRLIFVVEFFVVVFVASFSNTSDDSAAATASL